MPRAIVAYMHCPFCQNPDTKVVDTRESDDGNSIRRRRVCLQCGRRFTTIESTQLLILKRDGDLEPFSRDKVINGVRRACQGRHIDDAALRQLGRQVEERLRASGSAQVTSEQVGMAVLEPLRDVDTIAYLRFASVYRNFSSLDDFEEAVEELRRCAAGKTGGAGKTDETGKTLPAR